jgi:hypothetical protein
LDTYDPLRREDLSELALDLVTTDDLQRAMAVVYAYRHCILVTPSSLRLPLKLARLRFGDARGMTIIALNLSRRPDDLSVLWDGLTRSIPRGGPQADGRTGARFDQCGIDRFVEFMRRVGWRDGRKAEMASLRSP